MTAASMAGGYPQDVLPALTTMETRVINMIKRRPFLTKREYAYLTGIEETAFKACIGRIRSKLHNFNLAITIVCEPVGEESINWIYSYTANPFVVGQYAERRGIIADAHVSRVKTLINGDISHML